MAIHNSSYDSANTAVRAFLTKIGAKYWGRTFNTGSGNGKIIWLTIKDAVFSGMCCYCGKNYEKLQIEHLIMFNREEYGLHHPGNVAPVCKECNRRSKNTDGKHNSWKEHLKIICENNGDSKNFEVRREKILKHINDGEYSYPNLTDNEKHSIRVIAETLYNNVRSETDNSLILYEKITDAFVKHSLSG